MREVAVELGDGELEQAVAVELGQRERGDEQRVQLERAVVALRREVRADVRDLLGEAAEQQRRVVLGRA